MRRLFLLFLASGLLTACNSDKPYYERLAMLQDASMELVNTSYDYDLRIRTCAQVIDSLQMFLTSQSTSSYASTVQTNIVTWGSLRNRLEGEYKALMENVRSATSAEAVKAARKQHSWSDIEESSLQSSSIEKSGDMLIVHNTYSFRMRATLMSSSIYKFVVHVTAQANQQTGSVSVNPDIRVVE